MTCEQFQMALVGDDAAERAEAVRHAASCTDCTELLQADRDLTRRVDAWKAAAPAPPPQLRRRIAEAIDAPAPRVVPFRRAIAAVRPPLWIAAAAAAVLLVAVTWIGRDLIDVDARSDFEIAIDEAEKSRQQYGRAIAALEREVRPILARAGDPDLPPEQAALLLSFRDQLARLDGVIAEVQGFLNENPGHAGGNTVLLAAYTEKQDVLGRLLELPLGESL